MEVHAGAATEHPLVIESDRQRVIWRKGYEGGVGYIDAAQIGNLSGRGRTQEAVFRHYNIIQFSIEIRIIECQCGVVRNQADDIELEAVHVCFTGVDVLDKRSEGRRTPAEGQNEVVILGEKQRRIDSQATVKKLGLKPKLIAGTLLLVEGEVKRQRSLTGATRTIAGGNPCIGINRIGERVINREGIVCPVIVEAV